MRKWNAKERAFAAILAAPFAAVLVVGATPTETGGRFRERFDAAVAAASERWREYFGAEVEAQAVEPKKSALPVLAPVAPKLTSAAILEPTQATQSQPLTQASQATQSQPLTQASQATQSQPLTQASQPAQSRPLTQASQATQSQPLTQTSQAAQSQPLTQTSQAAQSRPLTQPTREETPNAETPEPDWTVAPDGTLERREARSPVDVGRVAVSTAPDGTRGGSAPSPPERTPNGLAPASPPVDLSQGAPVIPGTNDQWARGFEERWFAVEKERRAFKPIADNSDVYALDTQRPGHTYGNHTERETALWAAETERLVVEGSLIFHDANLLGSKNGVSCDMCHPDAEGTHAETYPKYQVQLGRPALLRDMANWCLTQPCRGEPMSGDDPRMRALEAYMISARAGKTLEYGKR